MLNLQRMNMFVAVVDSGYWVMFVLVGMAELTAAGIYMQYWLPDVPTVEEQGFPGYEMLSWNAVYAPAGTPAPIVLRMNQLINAAMAKPDIAARLTANGMVLRPGSPEDLANFQAAEIDKWKRLVNAAGIELQ